MHDVVSLQLFPSLDPAIEAALRGSIRRFGVLAPVCVSAGPWQPGALLDGHHRRRIAAEEQVECSEIAVPVRDEDEAMAIAVTLNRDRRHLDPAQRREVVADLRADGHSLRAIAGAIGVSAKTVHQDLAGVTSVTPEVHGRDGKTYPPRRPPVFVMPEGEEDEEISDEEMQVILDELEEAYDDDLTDEIIDQAVEDNLDSKRVPKPISKPDVGGGISHPARFSEALYPVFTAFLVAGDRVLDPFAGTGGIHRLAELVDVETVGVELEQPWVDLHPQTEQGTALDMHFPDESFDVICTSPTYGNRLADHHDASDPDRRRTYTHDLGRPLSEGNSGAMQWGPQYRLFHRAAWEEALRVLRPGGRFLLNIKDHIRGGKRQAVSAWHATTLLELGCGFVDCVPIVTPNLRFGANSESRLVELVWVFTKEIGL